MRVLDFTPFRQSLRARGAVAVEAFLSPGQETEFATWDHDRICQVRRGAVELEFADGACLLSENEILFLPAGTWHRWRAVSGGHAALFVVCFEPAYFAHIAPVAGLIADFSRLFPARMVHAPDRAPGGNAVRQILAAMKREKRAQREETPAMLVGLFIELMATLLGARRQAIELEAPEKRDRAFARSLAYLEEHLCDDISVNDLARLAQLSTRRYLDLFRMSFGKTPKQYIIERRIEIAKELMQETGSILHSSLDAGFANLSHFYRMFRRHTGQTPRQYLAGRPRPETARPTRETDAA